MKHDSLKVKKGASVARDAVVAGRELAAAIRQGGGNGHCHFNILVQPRI